MADGGYSVQRGLLRGSKISAKHSTVIDEAIPLVLFIKEIPEVSRIILGEIVVLKVGERRLRLVPVQAGFRIVVRGSTAQQTFFVYTADPFGTQKSIEQFWKK